MTEMAYAVIRTTVHKGGFCLPVLTPHFIMCVIRTAGPSLGRFPGLQARWLEP